MVGLQDPTADGKVAPTRDPTITHASRDSPAEAPAISFRHVLPLAGKTESKVKMPLASCPNRKLNKSFLHRTTP